MLNKSLLVSIFVLAATPAFADFSDCYEPIPPAPLDGKNATQEQMKHTLADVKDFIKQSDDYQNCMNGQYIAMERKAKQSKDKTPLDPSIAVGVKAKIDANQKLKEQVGAEFNTAAHDYNIAHPAK
jgi:cell pole-organizing protein PopZ